MRVGQLWVTQAAHGPDSPFGPGRKPRRAVVDTRGRVLQALCASANREFALLRGAEPDTERESKSEFEPQTPDLEPRTSNLEPPRPDRGGPMAQNPYTTLSVVSVSVFLVPGSTSVLWRTSRPALSASASVIFTSRPRSLRA